MIAIRTLVDPDDPKDLDAVHALQNAIKVEQPGGPGKFEVPHWDQVSQKKVREALLALGATLPDTKRHVRPKEAGRPRPPFDRLRLCLGRQSGKDALYLNVTPDKNDGKTIYRLNVKDVPVDGFWSISVYNAKGYFEPNQHNAYTLNNITAKKSPRRIGRDPIRRLRRQDPQLPADHEGMELSRSALPPRPPVLNGSWTFPEPRAGESAEGRSSNDRYMGEADH